MNETQMKSGVTQVNETLQQSILPDVSMIKRQSVSSEQELRGLAAIKELALGEAHKAGLFLDGCKIFLSGFEGPEMEKLRRVLNAGGATRFNQLTDLVSHVVIGKVVEDHMNTIASWSSKPHVVYGDWITESINLQKPADEASFMYGEEKEEKRISPKGPQPTKRKSLQDNDETLMDEDLMKKYLKGPTSHGMEDTLNMSSFPDSQQSTIPGIFCGKNFTIDGYNQSDTENLITSIRDQGGEVVSLDYEGKVDYSLIDPEGKGCVHDKAKEIVSHTFIEDCFDVEKREVPMLLDVEYYHIPSQFIKGSYPLLECTFAISAYTGLERQFLINLATCLGAKFQLSFARKTNPSRSVKASTHLVCPTPSGDKYKAALNWKVPAVTHRWLLACLKSGRKECEDSYRVDRADSCALDEKRIIREAFYAHLNSHGETTTIGETALDVLAPTPVNRKVKALRETESYGSPHEVKTPDMETIRRLYPTPGRELMNNLDDMPTPETPYGRTWNPNPPPHVRKAYKRMLDSLPDEPPAKKPANCGTPIEEYYKRFQQKVSEDFKNWEMKTPVWYKKQDDKTPKVEKIEYPQDEAEPEEALEETEITVSADNHGPLTGVVVYTAQKHQEQQRALYEAVANLGGDYRWILDDSVTHFIFQGQTNDKTKEFRAARDAGKIIVSPDWVWMCQDEKKRIDEELFPHTHNPKMSLSILSTKCTNNTSRRGRPRKKNVSGDDKGGKKEDQLLAEAVEEGSEVTSTSLNKSTLSKQLEEIEALATGCNNERRNSTRSKSVSEKLKQTPTREVQVETQPATMDIPETQNTAAITWDDPQEREARQKLQDCASRDTQDIIDDNMQQVQASSESEGDDKENVPSASENSLSEESSVSPTKDLQRASSSTKSHLFILSGISSDEWERYTAIIVGLGGTLSTDQFFNIDCTHVVTGKPTRSEKNLAAIASGKWLLHISFLEDSGKAGRFVEEEPYEYGNLSSTHIPTMTEESTEYKLSVASRRWRLEFLKDKKKRGAFHGMKALIHSSEERADSFSRLILAGGGNIVTSVPPYSDVWDVTHFFIEMNKKEATIDLAHFASRKIPCLGPKFLNDYLVEESPPDESSHLIPEYKEILSDMSSSNISIIKRRKSTRM